VALCSCGLPQILPAFSVLWPTVKVIVALPPRGSPARLCCRTPRCDYSISKRCRWSCDKVLRRLSRGRTTLGKGERPVDSIKDPCVRSETTPSTAATEPLNWLRKQPCDSWAMQAWRSPPQRVSVQRKPGSPPDARWPSGSQMAMSPGNRPHLFCQTRSASFRNVFRSVVGHP
jgi:hypothetical protein